MANSAPLVIVRIKGANSEGKDWMIPSEVSFRMVLVRRGHVLCCFNISLRGDAAAAGGP